MESYFRNSVLIGRGRGDAEIVQNANGDCLTRLDRYLLVPLERVPDLDAFLASLRSLPTVVLQGSIPESSAGAESGEFIFLSEEVFPIDLSGETPESLLRRGFVLAPPSRGECAALAPAPAGSSSGPQSGGA